MMNMKRAKASELTNHLGYWLRKLSNAVSGAFAGRLEKHGVSVAQWVVLRTLHDHEALPLKEIVARVEVDQGALSRMVDRLMARGLVKREADVTDGRAVAISLTKAGRNLVPKLAAEADRNEEEFFASLTQRRRDEWLRMIKELLAQGEIDRRSPVE